MTTESGVGPQQPNHRAYAVYTARGTNDRCLPEEWSVPIVDKVFCAAYPIC